MKLAMGSPAMWPDGQQASGQMWAWLAWQGRRRGSIGWQGRGGVQDAQRTSQDSGLRLQIASLEGQLQKLGHV